LPQKILYIGYFLTETDIYIYPMKKLLIVLLACISLSAMAQQENQFYIRIYMQDDTIGKYHIHFEKYTSTKLTGVPTGKTLSISSMQNAAWTFQKPILKEDETVEFVNWVYFDKQRKYYSLDNTDSMFASVVKIVIKEKETKQLMQISVPIYLNAKWNEIFLEKIKFVPGKYVDLIKHSGRFDEEDNTLKIVCDTKVKLKYASKSSFKL
jgi:hypothetical protein